MLTAVLFLQIKFFSDLILSLAGHFPTFQKTVVLSSSGLSSPGRSLLELFGGGGQHIEQHDVTFHKNWVFENETVWAEFWNRDILNNGSLTATYDV